MLRPGKLVTHVISQKPNFGAVLPGGGKVNLVVSRGRKR
jgi:beta-lactam-binding protein with PASTA domain